MLPTRASAGRFLAATVQPDPDRDVLVLAISREGLAVAAQVAAALGAEIELLCTKHSSIALAVDGVRPYVYLDRVSELGLHAPDVTEHLQHLSADLDRAITLFRGHRPFPSLYDRHVILVDDGSAPARVLDAIVQHLHVLGAGRVTLAVEASTETERVGDIEALALLERARHAAQPLRAFRH